ncbi:MAG: ABC transporter permease [Candidatus Thorarchaeota archaeon]
MGLQKHTNLASYALGNVLKYKTRSLAIVIALVFSCSLLCSAEFIREGLVQDVTASLDEGPDLIVQKLIGGRQAPVPEDWKENILNTSGVRIATPRVWGYTDVGGGSILTIMGVNATEYTTITGNLGTDLVEDGGRFLEETDTRKIVIGQGIVDLMATSAMPILVEVGTRLSLITFEGELIEFEIIGIFDSESKIYSYDMIITDITSAREVLGYDNSSYTDIAVWAEFGSPINDVAFRLDTSIPNARVLTRDAMQDILFVTYGGRAGFVALLWVVVLISVLLLAFTASSAGSDEARREVGLLKALGFDTVDVIEIRMYESLILGLLGASVGVSVAIIFDFYMGAPILAGYLLGWNLLLLNGGIPLAISAATIFTVYVVALVPILIASIIPAWRNAITEPDVVLRGV